MPLTTVPRFGTSSAMAAQPRRPRRRPCVTCDRARRPARPGPRRSPSRALPASPAWPTMMQCGSDDHVVGDLHKVVDLASAPDARDAEFGAVDAHARADLDIVLDDDRADLRDLGMFGSVPAIAEAIGAQHAVGVDDDAMADGDALADDDVREKLAIARRWTRRRRDRRPREGWCCGRSGARSDDRQTDRRPPFDRIRRKGRCSPAASLPAGGRGTGERTSRRSALMASSASSTISTVFLTQRAAT
jgi:hypothetical protein